MGVGKTTVCQLLKQDLPNSVFLDGDWCWDASLIGTVGQLQFEVIQYRLLHEYGAQCRWEPISLYKACWIESDDADALEAFKKRKYQFMATDREGRDVFLADSNYVLQMAQTDFPKIRFHFTSEF